MKDRKKYIKLLFPPVWLMLILSVFSAASLSAIFIKGLDTTPIAYITYVVSFYTLTVICVAFSKVFPGHYRHIRQKVYASRYGNRYMTDVAFKTHVSLYRSLAINLLYVLTNLFSGIWYGSVWFVTLAVYYSILAIMRFLLLRFANQNGIGKDRIREWRRARLCGMILMTLNLALSGVVTLVIRQNEGFTYGGVLIYVAALYTFYITTVAIINIMKYRKYKSPVMSTAKSINLAAALVSMLALETAMLAQFGSETTSPHFNTIMVGATGAGVCAIVVAMSVITIARANREIAAQKKSFVNRNAAFKTAFRNSKGALSLWKIKMRRKPFAIPILQPGRRRYSASVKNICRRKKIKWRSSTVLTEVSPKKVLPCRWQWVLAAPSFLASGCAAAWCGQMNGLFPALS